MRNKQIESIIYISRGGEGDIFMHRESTSLLFLSQIFFVGLIVIVSLLLASILISALGSNTVLAATDNPPETANSVSIYESPNIISDGGYAIWVSTQNAAISVGRNIYSNSKWITGSVTHVGSFVIDGSAVALRGTLKGVAFVGRGVGSVLLFTIKLPVKAVSSVFHAVPLKNIVRPSDSTKVPIINNQTSASVLARSNAEQRKQIEAWFESQKTANKHLGGLIITGDPKHGGYPAKWANAPQDSMVDKWGMYNRECVSYAAWKVYQKFGHMPYWGGVGNANQWVGDALAAGIPTGSKPKVHSVAISMAGYYGHAMWVEKVVGNMIYVSQYNYDLAGHYSEMWIKSSNLTYIYFN